jgi:hypothetical protein
MLWTTADRATVGLAPQGVAQGLRPTGREVQRQTLR